MTASEFPSQELELTSSVRSVELVESPEDYVRMVMGLHSDFGDQLDALIAFSRENPDLVTKAIPILMERQNAMGESLSTALVRDESLFERLANEAADELIHPDRGKTGTLADVEMDREAVRERELQLPQLVSELLLKRVGTDGLAYHKEVLERTRAEVERMLRRDIPARARNWRRGMTAMMMKHVR